MKVEVRFVEDDNDELTVTVNTELSTEKALEDLFQANTLPVVQFSWDYCNIKQTLEGVWEYE